MKRVVTHKSLIDQFCDDPWGMTVGTLFLLGLVVVGVKKLFGFD
jgi:hypothetical protein